MAKIIIPLTTLVLALVMIQNGDCAATPKVTLPGGAVVTLPGGAAVTLPGKVTLPGGAVVTVPGGGGAVVPGGGAVVPGGGGAVVPGGAHVTLPGGGAAGTGTTSNSTHNAAIISRSSFTVLVGAVALAVLAP